jgi:hypothetical protein
MNWIGVDISLAKMKKQIVSPAELLPFPAAFRVVPDVELSGKNVRWRPGGTKPLPAPDGRLLLNFFDLKDVDGVLRFAQTYGPLYLCEKHKLPVMHNRPTLCPPLFRAQAEELIIFEPVDAVLWYSQQARRLYALAELANAGLPISVAKWAEANVAGPYTTPGRAPTYGPESKQIVAGLVNWWLVLGDPRPSLTVGANGRFELHFRSGDQAVSNPPKQLAPAVPQLCNGGLLFATLAMQIASAVSGGLGLATCSACGTLYVPNRAPVPGRRSFCRQCGPRAAWRLSKREARRM